MTKKINVKVKKNADDIFEVVDSELMTHSISKDFEIELPSGKTIRINKHEYHTDFEDDADWDFCEPSDKKEHDKMSEEQQDLFYDFVQELSLID